MQPPNGVWHSSIILVIVAIIELTNSVHALKCYVCSSDKLESCSTLQMNEDKELPSELCPSNVASCFTKIENGITIRGCSSHRHDDNNISSQLIECNGSNDCSSCKTDKCNGNIFPENRLHCLHCGGSSCVNQTNTIDVRHPCVNYVADDNCYSVFSHDGSVAYRGCRSDPRSSIGKEFCLLHIPQCEECSKRGCNNQQVKWGKKLSCVKCNSTKSGNCNEVSDDFKASECAPTVESYSNECYIYVRNGQVERGCLYEASADIRLDCGNYYSDSCLLCDNSDCNRSKVSSIGGNSESSFNLLSEPIEVSQKKMLSHDRFCYHCDSRTDPNCAHKLNRGMLGLCPYSQEDMGCYHIKTDTFTKRGCVASLPESEIQNCSQTNDSCKMCSAVGCNDRIDFAECYIGDSKSIQPKNEFSKATPSKICDDYNDTCFVYREGFELVRGCFIEYLNKKNLDKTFFDVRNKKYRTCSTPLCNSYDVQPPRLKKLSWSTINEEMNFENKSDPVSSDPNTDGNVTNICYQCDSNSNPNCAYKLETGMIEKCPFDSENLGCYHIIKDSHVSRGCVVNLEEEEKRNCTANGDTCKTCSSSACNKNINFAKCYASESIDDQPKNSYGSQIPSKICKNYQDTCFVFANGESVIRDCTKDFIETNGYKNNFFDELPTSKYRLCSAPLCNDDEVKQLECYACNSETDLKCVANITNEMVEKCALEVQSSGCYHLKEINDTSSSRVERGCLSTLNDERKKICEADGDECKKCYGNRCNSKINFQRCLTCDKDHAVCHSELCRRYNDECYLHVSKNTIRRGCLSRVVDTPINGVDIVADCKDGDLCEKCSNEDDCNSKEVQKEYCIVCDSVIKYNNDCSLYPTLDLRTECPLAVKELGCFLSLDKQLRVTRGCLSQLSVEDRNACRESNETCKSCFGDSCNVKRFFQSCYECDSEDHGPDCQNTPWIMEQKLCKDYMGACYTEVKGEKVRRGCIGDESVPNKEDCSDPKVCKPCSSVRNCNDEPIWSEVCITCDSKKDEWCYGNFTNANNETCPLKATPQGCYHFINQSHVKRGCVSNLEKDEAIECNKNTSECKICMGPNCNSKKYFESCLTCSSQDDPNCVINPVTIHSKMCKRYGDECYTFIGKVGVSRGCFHEMGDDFQKQCRNDKNKCEVCTSDVDSACNNKTIIMETCADCDTEKDERCRDHPELFFDKICSTMQSETREGCFLSIVGDRLMRGCMQDREPNHKKYCSRQSDTCKHCFGKNCNKKRSFQECYNCNSRDEPQCAQNSTLGKTTICKEYLSTCLTGVDAHGHTHRCCSKNHPEDSDEFTYGFEICSQNKCNGNIFPKDRLKCYQCNGEDECDLLPTHQTDHSDAPLEPQPCTILSQYDQCYTYIDEDKKIFRGCLTDSTNSRLLCEQDGTTCVKCSLSGCNNQPKFKDPSLSCVKCNDTTDCAYGQNLNAAEVCQNSVPFAVSESCYMRIVNKTSLVERGCTLDVATEKENWCTTANDCEICNKSGCNTANVRYHWCIVCSSEINGVCSVITDSNNFIEQCNGDPYPHNMIGCFTMNKGGHVSRGCLKDLEPKEFEECNTEDWCNVCKDDNCNRDNIISSSSKQSISRALLNVLCIFVTLCFY